jgi:hypothetical protein
MRHGCPVSASFCGWDAYLQMFEGVYGQHILGWLIRFALVPREPSAKYPISVIPSGAAFEAA